MPFELEQALRLKGMVDAVVSAAPTEPSVTAAGALVETYRSTRNVCLKLVAGTEVEDEFEALFPLIAPLGNIHALRDQIEIAAASDRARILLAQLAGWLGSWPSAEQLLDELVTALEAAEVQADGPAEKARLASIREGLLGAGRQIAINVVSEYLKHVHV